MFLWQRSRQTDPPACSLATLNSGCHSGHFHPALFETENYALSSTRRYWQCYFDWELYFGLTGDSNPWETESDPPSRPKTLTPKFHTLFPSCVTKLSCLSVIPIRLFGLICEHLVGFGQSWSCGRSLWASWQDCPLQTPLNNLCLPWWGFSGTPKCFQCWCHSCSCSAAVGQSRDLQPLVWSS